MEFLSATGQVIFAAFLAGSQFVEPLRTDYVTAVNDRRDVQDWESRVYDFQPANLGELYSFSNEELAQYIRTSCLGMLDQLIPEQTRNQGSHFTSGAHDLIVNIVDLAEVEAKQERLIEPREEFSLKDGLEFIALACDRRYPVELISNFNLGLALSRYAEFYNEIPAWENSDQLPELPEVSFVRDLNNNIIGEFNKVDTLTVGENVETVRINRRLIVDDIPENLKKAVVSIEDAQFWNFKAEGSEDYRGHLGVSFKGFFRAGQTSIGSDATQGGSTITMQLAKNLVLYNDVHIEQRNRKRSMFRKIKELVLAKRLEDLLSKDEILDLYLNTIDFGRRSQGVEMASLSYFGKSVSELELHEMALIAALPKGPNFYNPGSESPEVRRRVKARRDYVLTRMESEGYISEATQLEFQRKAVEVIPGSVKSEEENYAHFYVSQIENEIAKRADSQKGIDITVPIHHELQKMAVQALQKGLLDFERNNGRLRVRLYEDRLPNIKERLQKLADENDSEDLTSFFAEVLEGIKPSQPDVSQFEIGVILNENEIGLKDGSTFQRHDNDKSGKLYKLVAEDAEPQNLEIWDTVFVQKIYLDSERFGYRVASTTEVLGGIVVMDIETGDVLATSGGYSIGAGARNKGPGANKAFVSPRQPGSTVKPFSYLYALQAGLKPYTEVSNLRTQFPARMDGREELRVPFAPNSTRLENNVLTMQKALASSQNYATMNLVAKAAGVFPYRENNRLIYPQDTDDELSLALENIHTLMERFGVYDNSFQRTDGHTILLGTKETTVANMAAAYATIARGGEYMPPKLIERITKNSEIIRDQEEDEGFTVSLLLDDESVKQRLSVDTYTLRSMLQGVLREGTARRISRWSDLIAGKTGTTDSAVDTWFVGFNNRVSVAVWVGYPETRGLGGTGASVALPVFEYFMESLYAKYPDETLNVLDSIPQGVEEFLIEPTTGIVITDDFQGLYRKATGRSGPMPSTSITYVEGRDAPLVYYNGSISGQLADFLFTRMDFNLKHDIEVEQTFQLNEIAKVHSPLNQQCINEVAQGYSESDLQSCRLRDAQNRKYFIYQDIRKYFLIYHNLRTWESFR